METVGILRAARAMLAVPGVWTREASARSSDGKRVFTGDARACRFCALGAVQLCASDSDLYELAALQLELVAGGRFGVIDVNDFATRVEPVLEMFDEAIAACEASGE